MVWSFNKALIVGAFALTCVGSASANTSDAQGYRAPDATESEFDNRRDAAAAPPLPKVASGQEAYEDTPFGDYLYSEASLATKLEMLRLLSKQTPPTQVFLHAVSMGLGVEEMLRASLNYEGGRSRELAMAAVNILPFVDQVPRYRYSGYEKEDIARDSNEQYGETDYLVSEVITRFFDDREILLPHPDWLEGQYHFDASAQELNNLLVRSKNRHNSDNRDELIVELGLNATWYKGADQRSLAQRPVFISLYEADNTIRIDNHERIESEYSFDRFAKVPVVFIFNKVNEVALDQLANADYPLTIRGVRDAYAERTTMLTPVPEWDLGEHHLYARLDEFEQLFELPTEDDFEPEHWQALLKAARDYSVDETAFLIVVMPNSSRDRDDDDRDRYSRAQSLQDTFSLELPLSSETASWDNPRSESAYPYVAPGSDGDYDDAPWYGRTNRAYLGDGLLLNRPDLIAALLYLRDELLIDSVPVAFYYVDAARVKTFLRGPRVLLNYVEGPGDSGSGGGNGGFGPPEEPPECASPPCAETN